MKHENTESHQIALLQVNIDLDLVTQSCIRSPLGGRSAFTMGQHNYLHFDVIGFYIVRRLFNSYWMMLIE